MGTVTDVRHGDRSVDAPTVLTVAVGYGAWSYHQGMLIRRVTHSASRFPTATLRRFGLTIASILLIAYGLGTLFHPGWGYVALGVGCLLLDFTAEDDNEGPPT